MSTFLLEIITPQRVAYQEQVEMVTVPSTDGVLGILAHHISLFASLAPGEVKIKQGSNEFFLSIGGGFIEVTQEKVNILVTKALHADELNEHEIVKAKEQAEKILKEKPVGEDRLIAEGLLRSSLIDFKILERRRHRSRHIS